jgi:hypothetical protein
MKHFAPYFGHEDTKTRRFFGHEGTKTRRFFGHEGTKTQQILWPRRHEDTKGFSIQLVAFTVAVIGCMQQCTHNRIR